MTLPTSAFPVQAAVTGDVTVEPTRLHSKGGSLTATLKKALRAAFDDGAQQATGARLDFGPHGSAVLIAPQTTAAALAAGAAGGHILVTRVHDRRFVVDWTDGTVPEPDAMTRAFLSLIVEQFKQGQRKLVGSDEAASRLGALKRPVRAAPDQPESSAV